jgi:hypothetical protein
LHWAGSVRFIITFCLAETSIENTDPANPGRTDGIRRMAETKKAGAAEVNSTGTPFIK